MINVFLFISFFQFNKRQQVLQEKIRKAGGKRNSNKKLWEIVYEKVPDGLAERIVEIKSGTAGKDL